MRKREPSKFRQVWIILGMPTLLVLLWGVACKPVPQKDLVGEEQRVKAEVLGFPDKIPTQIATPETHYIALPVSTSEVKHATTEVGSADQATGEVVGAFNVGTAEMEIHRKNEGYVITRAPLFHVESGVLVQSKLLLPGETVKVLEKVVLKVQNRQMPALYVEDETGAKGYFNTNNVCYRRICVFEDRSGVIEISSFGEITKRKVPQIRLVFYNLYPFPVKELRILGQFYYKGKKVGEDVAYPISISLGTHVLKSGELSTVFLRPVFSLNEKDKITPDNYIEVRVLCSVGYGKHEDCGDFKIDQMYY